MNRKLFVHTNDIIIMFAFFLLLSPREDVTITASSTTVLTNLFIYFSNEPVKYLHTLVNTYTVQDTSLTSTCTRATMIITDGDTIDNGTTVVNADCDFVASVPEWVYDANDRHALQGSYATEGFVVAVNAGFQSVNLTCAEVDSLAAITGPASLVCGRFETQRLKCVESAQNRMDFNAYFGAGTTALLPLMLWSSRTRDFMCYTVIAAWGYTIGSLFRLDTCTTYTYSAVGFVLAVFSTCMFGVKLAIVVAIHKLGLPLYDNRSGADK
jgi:hypothetical protein